MAKAPTPPDTEALRARVAELETELAAYRAEVALPPKLDRDGNPNRDYYRERFRLLNRQMEVSVSTTGNMPKGYKQALDGLQMEIRFAKLTIEDITDPRSTDQRIASFREAFLKDPAALLEQGEKTLRAVRTQVEAAVDHTERLVAEDQKHADARADKYKAIQEKYGPPKREALAGMARTGRRWVRLLSDAVRLQEMCRHELPPFVLKDAREKERVDAWRGSYITRFAIYVFRSNDTSWGTDIIEAAPHVCTWGYDLWKAWRRARVLPSGHDLTPGGRGGLVKDITDCDGIFMAGPPRHSKTTMAIACVALDLCENPRKQWKATGARDDKPEANLGEVARCFDAQLPRAGTPGKHQDTPQGRRCYTLFPNLPRKARKDNSAGSLRLDIPDPTIAPQMQADGVFSSVAGENTEGILADDVCDSRVAEQPTERDRVTAHFTGKWLTRHQGRRPFTIYLCTIWHEDDTSSHLRRLALKGELNWAVSTQFVGNEHSKPPFFSIWHRYPPAKLKQLRATMGEVAYSAQFCGNPHPESRRIVKRLAFYLARAMPGATPTEEQERRIAEHREFLKGMVGHLSLDPSATAKQTSDESGIVYVGAGAVVSEYREPGRVFRRTRRVARVLDAEEIKAEPLAAIMHLAHYTQTHKTDYIHVETVAFSYLVADNIRTAFNLSNSQVIDHPTRNLDKPTRLRAVSPMVDDSQTDFGMPGAVVEFPAVLMPDGTVVPEPALNWLLTQILQAGQGGKDHGLDAFTQVCNYLAREVDVGVGAVSAAVEVVLKQIDDGRPERFAHQRLRLLPGPRATAAEEEVVHFMELS